MRTAKDQLKGFMVPIMGGSYLTNGFGYFWCGTNDPNHRADTGSPAQFLLCEQSQPNRPPPNGAQSVRQPDV